jgi:hypothetical protein
MKTLRNLSQHPETQPLLADEIVEFHAARLLLLLKLCGTTGRIDSLTKMAKLDFFVRYPQFFAEACKALGEPFKSYPSISESSMVRYHYGPWDQRYYHILAYLESRGLLDIRKERKNFVLILTSLGNQIAVCLEKESAYRRLVEQMHSVKKVLGQKSGTRLKGLIYEIFDKDIAQLPLGEVIRQ